MTMEPAPQFKLPGTPHRADDPSVTPIRIEPPRAGTAGGAFWVPSGAFDWKNAGVSAMARSGLGTRIGSLGSLAGIRRMAMQAGRVAGAAARPPGARASSGPSP